MFTSRARSALTLLLALVAIQPAYGRLVGEPDLRRLTAAANTILVAEVLADQTLGPTTLTDRLGNPEGGEEHLATLRIDEVLAGDAVPTTLVIAYGNNPGWDHLHLGIQTPHFRARHTELFFLNCTAPSTCTLVNSEDSSVSVTHESFPVPTRPPDDSLYLRVIQRIAAGLFAPSSAVLSSSGDRDPRDPRFRLIHVLKEQHDTPYVDTLLHAALAQATLPEECEIAILSDLLLRGDLSVLPAAAEVLSRVQPSPPSASLGLLLNSLDKVPWPQALSLVTAGLHSANPAIRLSALAMLPRLVLRDTSAQHSAHAAIATHLLLPLLHDGDQDVVFHAMLALSDLNGHPDFRPSQVYSPPRPCPACLQFWLNFPDPTLNQPLN